MASAAKVAGRWTVDEDRLLGTAIDAEIARKLGRDEASVYQRRRRLGIAATFGGTRVTANPRGYPIEPHTGFDPSFVVEV